MSISPDGAFLYVSAWFIGRLWKIDARTLEVVARFEVPPHSRRVQPSPDGSTLIVASYLTGEVLGLDARTGAVRRRMFVAPKPEGVRVGPVRVGVGLGRDLPDPAVRLGRRRRRGGGGARL